MSNLKDDLNQYLNRGDQLKNGISFGKQTFNKIFKKVETEDNEDLLNGDQKYYRAWFTCPSMSRTQKLISFCICICLSFFFFGLSLLYIPVILLKARKFAIFFTLGSCSALSSFAFLWGPASYLKHLCSTERIPFTSAYITSLLATLYFSLVARNTLATTLSAVIQIIALVWFIITYIPGGQTGLTVFKKVFTSAVSSSVSNTLPVYEHYILSVIKNKTTEKHVDVMNLENRLNIDVPRWDQNTYTGRLKYFFNVTNPLNILKTDQELNKAKEVVDKYKSGEPLPGITMENIYNAKDIVDSAFHPETGEKMIIFGRMSAQVPMNMLITGCMITFYKSTPAVVFWQWFNQSFNALVNYTNRSGSSEISTEQITKSYSLATGGAVSTAIILNRLAKRAPSVVSRLVPFAAVAAANCINIPLMRCKELEEGIPVVDENNNLLGHSKKAATYGISAVVLSRICMCAPGMIFTPFIMEWVEKKGVIRRYPWLPAPMQLLLCGVFLTFATPMCCALFPQTYPISISKLENEIQETAKKLNPNPVLGYYNKGL